MAQEFTPSEEPEHSQVLPKRMEPKGTNLKATPSHEVVRGAINGHEEHAAEVSEWLIDYTGRYGKLDKDSIKDAASASFIELTTDLPALLVNLADKTRKSTQRDLRRFVGEHSNSEDSRPYYDRVAGEDRQETEKAAGRLEVILAIQGRIERVIERLTDIRHDVLVARYDLEQVGINLRGKEPDMDLPANIRALSRARIQLRKLLRTNIASAINRGDPEVEVLNQALQIIDGWM